MALVPIDLYRVVEEAKRATKAWTYLAGCWDGRIHRQRPDGKPAPHSDCQPSCIRDYVPADDRRDEGEWTTVRRSDQSRADQYEADRAGLTDLNQSRRRLTRFKRRRRRYRRTDCDHETLDALKLL
jgi:hypothetical protein